ncbi:MAG: hypothetical protein PGN09_07510 [Sphingomonas fennica]
MAIHPTILFPAAPGFGAWIAVEAALKAAGFSIGAMKAHRPRCILHGAVTIAKWHNLTREEQAACHGQAWGCRDGSVTVMIHADCPAAIVPLFEPVRLAAARAQPEWASE